MTLFQLWGKNNAHTEIKEKHSGQISDTLRSKSQMSPTLFTPEYKIDQPHLIFIRTSELKITHTLLSEDSNEEPAVSERERQLEEDIFFKA